MGPNPPLDDLTFALPLRSLPDTIQRHCLARKDEPVGPLKQRLEWVKLDDLEGATLDYTDGATWSFNFPNTHKTEKLWAPYHQYEKVFPPLLATPNPPIRCAICALSSNVWPLHCPGVYLLRTPILKDLFHVEIFALIALKLVQFFQGEWYLNEKLFEVPTSPDGDPYPAWLGAEGAEELFGWSSSSSDPAEDLKAFADAFKRGLRRGRGGVVLPPGATTVSRYLAPVTRRSSN